MSEKNETTAIVPAKPKDLSRAEFGSREDIAALANRIKAMMPGGDKLSPTDALATAQYALTVGANPFRGELYAYTDKKGKLQLVEGYKLLVRWAKAKCDYSEWYDPMDGLPNGAVGFWCNILRKDQHQLLEMLLKADNPRAMEIVTTTAGGVVRPGDGTSVPKGWTLEDVAKKRALMNALKRAYGAPSLQEVAASSWQVNGHDTRPEDWQDVRAGMTPNEAEAVAAYSAAERERHERPPTVENATEAVADLFGDEAAADFAETDEDVTEGEAEELPPDIAHEWTREEAGALFHWTRNELVITDQETLRALGVEKLTQFPGDLDNARLTITSYLDAVPA